LTGEHRYEHSVSLLVPSAVAGCFFADGGDWLVVRDTVSRSSMFELGFNAATVLG
jgi:hypothetical protein